MCEYLKALQKPFPAEDIEWRISHCVMTKNGPQALVLAYVTNRAIMERLDEVFGIAGWKNEYHEWRDKGVKCTITCKVDGEWISKEDGADVTDMEATKGGFSNAMKRAGYQWGIGRYLYKLDQVWAPIQERGQNYVNTQVKVGNDKQCVKGYWDTPKLPKWALPEGYDKAPQPQAPLPEEPPEVDEDLAAIAAASAETYAESPSTTQKPTTTGEFVTEGQAKMLFAKYKQSEYKDLPVSDVAELISAHLSKQVTDFKNVEKKDVNTVIKWFDEHKAAS